MSSPIVPELLYINQGQAAATCDRYILQHMYLNSCHHTLGIIEGYLVSIIRYGHIQNPFRMLSYPQLLYIENYTVSVK